MLAFSSAFLALALSAAAVPSVKRQTSSDNGACQALQKTCEASVASDLSNAWNIKACVFGATCFGGHRPVDNFLAAVASTKNVSAHSSASLPRMTSSFLASISTDAKTVSQQNFIDGFYSSLGASNGPYPTNVDIVISYYQRVATWTAFCTSNVPFKNFADYFQFSASVSGHGCSSPSTSTTTAPASTVTIPTVSDDSSCQKMFTTCLNEVDSAMKTAWAHKSCVFGAACLGGQRSVATFIGQVWRTKNSGSSTAPSPESLPRLSSSVFGNVSTDGRTWTQQNFIDGYFGELSAVGGPFPPNASQVIAYFQAMLKWTGFCPGQGIPYMNTADWFQYSSTVQGGNAKC